MLKPKSEGSRGISLGVNVLVRPVLKHLHPDEK